MNCLHADQDQLRIPSKKEKLDEDQTIHVWYEYVQEFI